MKLLASYVSSGGDLKRLDKSCVDKMPALNLTVSSDYQSGYFSTDDVYNGDFDESLSSPEESEGLNFSH